MSELIIPYSGFKNLERHFVIENTEMLRTSIAGRSVETYLRYWNPEYSIKFGDWLWDQYGARFVKRNHKRYLEFCTEEQKTLFLLTWS